MSRHRRSFGLTFKMTERCAALSRSVLLIAGLSRTFLASTAETLGHKYRSEGEDQHVADNANVAKLHVGAARLHRAASRDRRERGRPAGSVSLLLVPLRLPGALTKTLSFQFVVWLDLWLEVIEYCGDFRVGAVFPFESGEFGICAPTSLANSPFNVGLSFRIVAILTTPVVAGFSTLQETGDFTWEFSCRGRYSGT